MDFSMCLCSGAGAMAVVVHPSCSGAGAQSAKKPRERSLRRYKLMISNRPS